MPLSQQYPGPLTSRADATDGLAGGPRPSCDVCVVTYNSEESIGRLLRSLARDPAVGTVFILDNASSDDTVAAVGALAAELPIRICLERSPVNLGFARGCNRLLARAKADVVALINPDVELSEGALTTLSVTASSDRSIGIVSCRLTTRDGRPQSEAARTELRLRKLVVSSVVPRRVAQLARRQSRPSRPGPRSRRHHLRPLDWLGVRAPATLFTDLDVDCTSGALMVFRRHLLHTVGYLDESVFMYLEDVDFCARVRRAGLRIRYVGSTPVWHDAGVSARRTQGELFALLPQVWLTYVRRYGDRWERLLARPALTAVCLAEFAKRLAGGERPRGEARALWHTLTYRPRSKPWWA